MAELSWDNAGEKKFQNGISHGVLYTRGDDPYDDTYYGVAWNGITSVTESPEGAEKNDVYADNMKYASQRSKENFGGTIEAYTYPVEFEKCDGSATIDEGALAHQQNRDMFCLSYRTRLNSDTDPDGDGYLLHLVYNCSASPSERAFETINDSPDAITFSWEFDSLPEEMDDGKMSSTITIDSTKVRPERLARLETILYGTDEVPARMAMPGEIKRIMSGLPVTFVLKVDVDQTLSSYQRVDFTVLTVTPGAPYPRPNQQSVTDGTSANFTLSLPSNSTYVYRVMQSPYPNTYGTTIVKYAHITVEDGVATYFIDDRPY